MDWATLGNFADNKRDKSLVTQNGFSGGNAEMGRNHILCGQELLGSELLEVRPACWPWCKWRMMKVRVTPEPCLFVASRQCVCVCVL